MVSLSDKFVAERIVLIMDDGCVAIIGFIVVIAIAIALIVYVVLPLSLILLGSIVAAGTISGIGVAGKNFYEVLIEAHNTIK